MVEPILAVATCNFDPPRLRKDTATDGADERRLAGAIWTEQAKDLASTDLKSQAVQNLTGAIADRQPINGKRLHVILHQQRSGSSDSDPSWLQ